MLNCRQGICFICCFSRGLEASLHAHQQVGDDGGFRQGGSSHHPVACFVRSHVTEHLPGYFAELPSDSTGDESSERPLMITMSMLEARDRATEYRDLCVVLGISEMEPGDIIQGLAGRMQESDAAAAAAEPAFGALSHIWTSRKQKQARILGENQHVIA